MIRTTHLQPFLTLIAWVLLAAPLAQANNTAGELEITDADGQRRAAMLLTTRISGSVNGMMASIKVQQTFRNDCDDWVNGRYVFPLPDGAAVDSLQIEIGERIIAGVIKEKAEAKKAFEQARRAGKKAGLLQQHRPNLFSISLANIGPQEEIVASITFIDKVHYENDTFSLRLPTTLTARYVPGAPIKSIQEAQLELSEQFEKTNNEETVSGFGWANNTDAVVDASDITPPQIYPHKELRSDGQTSHRFSLALSLDAGLDLQSVASQTHRISTQFVNSKKVDINLANSQEPMDRDLVISWQAIIGGAPTAALFQQKFNNAYYSLLMLTPPPVNSSLSLPRDITFIVDSSGSMAGNSMAQAKQALHQGLAYLSGNDQFNIIDFDSSFRPLFRQSQVVTPQRLVQAHAMIDQLEADGGTEMMGALNYALTQNSDRQNEGQHRLRQIVFITDGAVANEAELFKLLHHKLGDARLFTVGIGSAPNAFFMNRAARFGRGSYTFISDLAQVSAKMATLFKRITHPVLKDIVVDWQQQNIEQYPDRLPDLYAGEPLTLLVKSGKPIDKVKVSGSMLNSPWQQTIKRDKGAQAGDQFANTDHLDTLWARQKVASLMDKLTTSELSPEQVKPVVIKLGMAHQIVTKFTSFVAVEQEPSKPVHARARHQNVPNLMPQGSTIPIPQTATPQALFALLGGLLMLLGGIIRRGGRVPA